MTSASYISDDTRPSNQLLLSDHITTWAAGFAHESYEDPTTGEPCPIQELFDGPEIEESDDLTLMSAIVAKTGLPCEIALRAVADARRFLRDGRRLAQIHESIAAVFDLGEYDMCLHMCDFAKTFERNSFGHCDQTDDLEAQIGEIVGLAGGRLFRACS